jgi:hypothetical protein
MGEHLTKLVIEGRKAGKRIVHDKNTGNDVLSLSPTPLRPPPSPPVRHVMIHCMMLIK